MTGDETKPRRRRLSEEEHVLWRGVTRSIAPLKRRHSPAAPKAATNAARPDAAAMSARAGALARGAPTSGAPASETIRRRSAGGSEDLHHQVDLHFTRTPTGIEGITSV
jgi:hypothetical protein